MKKLLVAGAFMVLPAMGYAASVDLSGWTENGFKGNNGAGTWVVQGANNDSVLQTANSLPTVFFEAGSNAQGTSLAGEITVETAGDDDFVGFVLGYQDGELNSTNADFWMIDWKQGDQGAASAGLTLSHVTGDVANVSGATPFWVHSGVVSEVQQATTFGNTGWSDFTTYTFELIFTENLIEVSVDGNTELSYSSADHGSLFTDGAFGFYNNSQDSVRYGSITEEVIPTPIPASLPLLLAGLGGFAALRRRRG